MKRGAFPIQADCDPKNPEEFATWALVALPHMNGAALPMSSEYMQMVSKHLWDCGFRWHRKWQRIKWRSPRAGDLHWLTNPGYWVKRDEPDPVDDGRPDMVKVMAAMRQADEQGFFKAVEQFNKKGTE